MIDLIDRQAAITAIQQAYIYTQEGFDKAAVKINVGLTKALHTIQDLPSAQPEIIRCKDCKHFHYDMPYVIQGIPVLGHEVCDFWGDGCKTSENGFCSYAGRRTDE